MLAPPLQILTPALRNGPLMYRMLRMQRWGLLISLKCLQFPNLIRLPCYWQDWGYWDSWRNVKGRKPIREFLSIDTHPALYLVTPFMVPGKFPLSQVRLRSLLPGPIDCCLQRCTSFECCGLWEIKWRGAVTVVQNPVDAQHPSMPLNALNSQHTRHARLAFAIGIGGRHGREYSVLTFLKQLSVL
jgi:hypothetical protein